MRTQSHHPQSASCLLQPERVIEAIERLGTGLLKTPGNRALHERLQSGALSELDYLAQVQRVVLRLLMLLVADEDRDLNASLQRMFCRPSADDESEMLDWESFVFTRQATPDLDGALLDDQQLHDVLRTLGSPKARPVDFGGVSSEELGSLHEALLERQPQIDLLECTLTLISAADHERKTSGSFYTPRVLIDRLLETVLDPVVNKFTDGEDSARAESALLGLKVCDPACGSGNFLIATADRLAWHLARLRTGDASPESEHVQRARRDVIDRCLYGVDSNPMAVEFCRFSLWRACQQTDQCLPSLSNHIRCGNSLLGLSPQTRCSEVPRRRYRDPHHVGDWQSAFPEVFQSSTNALSSDDDAGGQVGGFDVVLGNPPWVSYTGRQQAPIESGELQQLIARFPCISRWPATHSAFLVLVSQILRTGGRAGLVLPMQVASLDAYGPVRAEVLRLASVDSPVIDAGEGAFSGVTQAVGLYALRGEPDARGTSADCWPSWRAGSHGVAITEPRGAGEPSLVEGIVDALAGRPKFAAGTFSDPGVHTGNVAQKIVLAAPVDDMRGLQRVREGKDVAAFRCGPPRKWLWTAPVLGEKEYCRIRPHDRYRDLPILVRQTANRPIAARHAGPTYFRNSLLGCAGVAGVAQTVVVAYLNSALYAVLHRTAVQDSRQRSFPQVKVAHLQGLPTIPQAAPLQVERLDALVCKAEQSVTCGDPIPRELLERIEQIVLASFDLDADLAPVLLDMAAAGDRRARSDSRSSLSPRRT